VPLDTEQRKALDEVFFGQYSGAIGQKALIQEFNRKNEKQRLSLERWKAQKSKKKTPEEYAALKQAGTLPKPWISTRQINLYVASQETNQLMQDSKAKSKSRAIVIPEDEQIPFVRMQGDSIVLTGAKDGRHPLVVTLVDVYSRYSWQRAIETNAQGKFSQEASAKAVISIIDAIKKRFGDDAIQPGSRWQFDNGGEFKRGTPVEDDEEVDVNEDTGYFKRTVEAHEPKIRVVYSQPNNPNSNALAERSVHDWRGVARRMLFNRDPRMAKAKTAKKDAWFKNWFGTIASEGRYGEQLNTINSIMNDTPVRTLGVTPTEFLAALMDDDRSDEEQKMITDVNKKLVDSQEKRRSASSQKPFSKDDWVRLSNAAYVKATLRGNYEKFNPRWSTEVYRIRKVTGGNDGRPYQYQIESFNMDDPEAETTSKKSFYRELRNQEDLLKIPKVKPQRAPTALVRQSKPYDDSFPFDDLPDSNEWSKGDRISVRWRRVRKLNSSADDLVYDNPELLQKWLQEDRLLAVRDDTIWADGTINLVRNVGANYTLRIRFDDGVQGTINLTNESSLNYVPPASVRRVMTGSGAEISLYTPFKSTAKNKKYAVYVLKDGRRRLIHFGDSRYGHYEDRLKHFSHLDHKNQARRDQFYRRFGGVSRDRNSALYWAQHVLW
jgi:hypothetical protein